MISKDANYKDLDADALVLHFYQKIFEGCSRYPEDYAGSWGAKNELISRGCEVLQAVAKQIEADFPKGKEEFSQKTAFGVWVWLISDIQKKHSLGGLPYEHNYLLPMDTSKWVKYCQEQYKKTLVPES